MSTPNVTPDQSNLASAVTSGGDPSQNYPPSPDQGGPTPTSQAQPSTPSPAPQQPTSRLQTIMRAVADVVSTGLQGIPDKGRPNFVSGLGQGARAENAVQQQQQAIKFRNFDDQVRLAQLHNQDLALQNATQAQQDAHTAAELNLRDLAERYGVDYDTIANHGPAVVDHLTASTATNGVASVPPGAHVSADGDNIYIPQNTQKTRDGQMQMYRELAPALGLPALPEGAQFVPNKNTNFLTNKMLGYGLDGNPIQHQDLPGYIAAEQTQRDSLAKNGGTANQLAALDKIIAIHKASLKALDEHAQDIADQASQRKQDEQTNQIQQKGAQQRQTNAAKPQKQQVVLALNPNGGSDVMNSDDAAQQGLKVTTPLKAGDVQKLNGTIAGFNDVQTKTNQLADIVNSGDFAKVQAPLAQAMIEKGLTVDMNGVSVPFGRINAALNSENAKNANPATRKFVVAWLGAHEAVTQLPRLQTFGTSNRMTEKQMEAAQQMLPQAGDDPELAQEKLSKFQDVLDPLRKQVPRMPGAGLLPTFRERQQSQPQSGGSNLGKAVTMGDATSMVNRLVPNK